MSAVENRLLLGGVFDALPETWHAGKPLDVRVRLMVMAWGNAFRVVSELESALDEVHEYQCGCYNGTVLEQAICELWRGRSIISSVGAARLSREKADALLVALGEMPADHAEQVAALSSEDATRPTGDKE